MKKIKFLLMAFFVVVFLSGCGSRGSYEPTVWIVGDYYGPDGTGVPAVWKNGEMTVLPSLFDINRGMANAIYVDGTDVYVAGTNDVGFSTPVYWKNGVVTELQRKAGYETVNSAATGIGVVNGSLYVAGDVTANMPSCPAGTYPLEPVYWKDGAMNLLPVDNECWGGGTKGLTIDGSDIYIYGWMYTGGNYIQPVYWKNGAAVKIPLPDGYDGGYVSALKVVKGKVYLSITFENTEKRIRKPAIWYDNTLTVLVTDERYDVDLQGIAVSGSTIYSVGYYNFGVRSYDTWPVLWTGITWQKLSVTDETLLIRGNAADITMFNGATYVVGWTGKLSVVEENKLLAIPCYWKNGVRYDLPLSDKDGEVEAVPRKILVQ